MDHYSIIHDEQMVREFITWLPDIDKNEFYLICLFARRKYCPEIIKSNDKTQLSRDVVRKKEYLIGGLKKWELPIGHWRIKDTIAPPESLVAYITCNPHCQKKSAWAMLKRLTEILENNSEGFNVAAEALSAMQKDSTTSKKSISVFDVDDDKENIDLSKLYNIFPEPFLRENVRVTETRGGVHILVEAINIKNVEGIDKMWWQKIHEMFKIDKDAHPFLTPVPGTIQGNHVPKLLIAGKDF